jgi:hypothetical protein
MCFVSPWALIVMEMEPLTVHGPPMFGQVPARPDGASKRNADVKRAETVPVARWRKQSLRSAALRAHDGNGVFICFGYYLN